MKISVIVPVYNAERYLDKLVQSVLSQTYEDYELILVARQLPALQTSQRLKIWRLLTEQFQ